MAIYSVELFGLSHLFPGRHGVRVELGDEVTLGELAAGLRQTMPALDTKVIRAGEDLLESHYCCNVNGRFHLDDYDAKVKAADHILIVTFALGG